MSEIKLVDGERGIKLLTEFQKRLDKTRMVSGFSSLNGTISWLIDEVNER